MSLVADGPLIHVSGRVGSRRASASGTLPTTWFARTTQTCRSGSRLSARRPWPGPRVEDDRAGLGDRHGAAGDDAVELRRARGASAAGRPQTARHVDRRQPRVRNPVRDDDGASRPRAASTDATARGESSGASSGGRSPGSRRPARRTARRCRCRRGGAVVVARDRRRPAADPRAPRESARERPAGHRSSRRRGGHQSPSPPAVGSAPPGPERFARRSLEVARPGTTPPIGPGPGSRPIRPRRPNNRPADRRRSLGQAEAAAGVRSAQRGRTHRRRPRRSAAGGSLRDWRTTCPRRWTRTSGMSIRTGQTSKHAPHSDDAYGSDAVCLSTGWLRDAAELRRQDRADRARVDRPVGLAAGPLVDRADVEAGRAADAAERLAPDRVRQHVGPAVVEQDRWNACGPSPGVTPGPHRGVRVHPLRRRRARQQLEEDLEVAPGRDELLDPHDRDQRPRAASGTSARCPRIRRP